MSDFKIDIRVLEKDTVKANSFAQEFEKVFVLNADGTSTEALVEAGVSIADWFCALTKNDDHNILSSLLAKHLGVRKVITLIRKPDYAPLLKTIGIDRPVSLREVAASKVIKYVRKGKFHTASFIAQEEAEILEIEVKRDSKIVGKPLKKLHIPNGVLFGLSIRGEQIIIPRGDYIPFPGDKIIIIGFKSARGLIEKLIS